MQKEGQAGAENLPDPSLETVGALISRTGIEISEEDEETEAETRTPALAASTSIQLAVTVDGPQTACASLGAADFPAPAEKLAAEKRHTGETEETASESTRLAETAVCEKSPSTASTAQAKGTPSEAAP